MGLDIELDLTDLVMNSALSDVKAAKILIVEDDPLNAELLSEILDEEGYRNVSTLSDPYRVLPSHKKNKFDLILLDIQLPGMSGIQVLEQLQRDSVDEFLPVIMLTAYNDRHIRKKVLEAGARDFISKPFENWEVLLRIRNILHTKFYYSQQILRVDLMENEVSRRTKEIRETQFEIIQRLAVAGELRDNETGAHVKRMSHICSLLADKRGFSSDFSELMLYASAMHDVGKIGIPDSILLKTKMLSPMEWEVMKQHPKIGARIIGSHKSPLISLAREISLFHHEKWDGSGYPHQISGDKIPVSARIAAISDVFDALTSDRPYKKAWSIEKSVEMIKEESGKHFEPVMVSLLIESLPEIIEIRERYRDNDYYLH
jgi:putative two-component system response regulator